MRPNLNMQISIEDFNNYYWLKEELQAFCREQQLSASGSKIEISERIEVYLITGEKKAAKKATKAKNVQEVQHNLTIDTVITANHRCSQQVRAFFKTIIPKFHFSTYIQDYFKNNVGKTYRDAVDAWHEEDKRKKDPSHKKQLAPQFEYNQFTRDYFADPNNKGKTRNDAIEAWNTIKKLPGSNKYTTSK